MFFFTPSLHLPCPSFQIHKTSGACIFMSLEAGTRETEARSENFGGTPSTVRGLSHLYQPTWHSANVSSHGENETGKLEFSLIFTP